MWPEIERLRHIFAVTPFMSEFPHPPPIPHNIYEARSKIGIPRGCPKFVTTYLLNTLYSNESEKKGVCYAQIHLEFASHYKINCDFFFLHV